VIFAKTLFCGKTEKAARTAMKEILRKRAAIRGKTARKCGFSAVSDANHGIFRKKARRSFGKRLFRL